MGADLYINSIHDKWKETWEPRFQELCAQRDMARAQFIQQYGREPKWLDANEDINELPEQTAVTKHFNLEYEAPIEEVGYFRDSYNRGSVFAYLGYSWWALAERSKKKNGFLPRQVLVKGYIQPDVCRVIAEQCTVEPMPVLDYLKQQHQKDVEMAIKFDFNHKPGPFQVPTEEDLAEWTTYFLAKQMRLVRFFHHAADLKEAVYASV